MYEKTIFIHVLKIIFKENSQIRTSNNFISFVTNAKTPKIVYENKHKHTRLGLFIKIPT